MIIREERDDGEIFSLIRLLDTHESIDKTVYNSQREFPWAIYYKQANWNLIHELMMVNKTAVAKK